MGEVVNNIIMPQIPDSLRENEDSERYFVELERILNAMFAGDQNVAGDLNVGGNIRVTPVYDDMQIDINNVKLPASSAPREALVAYAGAVSFPTLAFDVGEYIYFEVQTSHSMKLNTILDNHIHYTLPNTTNIGDVFKFQLDVVAAGIHEDWAVPTGSPFTKVITVGADADTKHNVSDIADIPAVNTTVSTIYKCKLTRISAAGDGIEYGSEVYVDFTDCHYQKDTLGSETESVK